MQANVLWKKYLKKDYIEEHYTNKIKNSTSVGMDRITAKKFRENLDENINIIRKKVNNRTYTFTRYRQLLVSKGKNKNPRCICIPTIRDKLVLSILNEILFGVYGKKGQTQMPQVIISEIVNELRNYKYFIKLDIKTFYASIDHEILMKKLNQRIHKKEIRNLIEKSIKTPEIAIPIKTKNIYDTRSVGIPEGLSISNFLANIYMIPIDEKYSCKDDILYFRYVDDILLLANKENFQQITKELVSDLTRMKLCVNDKKDEGRISKGFEYLGYMINEKCITVRLSSIYKIENSFEELIKEYKRKKLKNLKYLEWKINLKVTGFIMEKNKYGWMFFYSQITDISLLYRLDNTLNKILKRYGISHIHVKRFVRVYHEITKALHKTKYIINTDNLSDKDKSAIMEDIYDIEIKPEIDIDEKFRKLMMREVKDIEKDIQCIS